MVTDLNDHQDKVDRYVEDNWEDLGSFEMFLRDRYGKLRCGEFVLMSASQIQIWYNMLIRGYEDLIVEWEEWLTHKYNEGV